MKVLISNLGAGSRKRTHFYFCLLHGFYHVSVIVGQVKKASAFSRGWELPKSIIPTYRYHVICWIHLEQFPESPENKNKMDHQALPNYNRHFVGKSIIISKVIAEAMHHMRWMSNGNLVCFQWNDFPQKFQVTNVIWEIIEYSMSRVSRSLCPHIQ